MINKWLSWAFISSVMIILLMAIWLSKVESDNDLLRLDYDNLSRVNLTQALELEASRAALASREAERERLANENAALVAAINEVYANDPAAKNWADALCPDGILCLLD